jgi:hypothetical protein
MDIIRAILSAFVVSFAIAGEKLPEPGCTGLSVDFWLQTPPLEDEGLTERGDNVIISVDQLDQRLGETTGALYECDLHGSSDGHS